MDLGERATEGGRRPRIPALDSVRAIAISFVLLRHAWPAIFGASGFAGVELFFVLSGFLITGILVSDHQAGTQSLRRFYANRALRLYPALVVLVLCVASVILVADPSGDRGSLAGGVVTALTYTTDLQSWPLPTLGELSHLWTLAVEEQFYLIWPVFLLASLQRGKLRQLCWCALGCAVAASTLTVVHGTSDPLGIENIYTWPTLWAVTLIAGALYAVGFIRVQSSRWVGMAALTGLVAVCFGPQARYVLDGYVLVLPVVAVLAVLLVANAAGDQPLRFLTHPIPRYLGRISYAVYLWSYPFTVWISGSAAIPLSIVAGSLSYHLVERRFLRLRRSGALIQDGGSAAGAIAISETR